MDIEKVLRQSEFFKGIADDNLRALAYISIPKKLERKKTIFLKGQEGHSIFLLVHGAVKLYKTSPVGKKVVIKIIYPGEIFGEVILFEK